LFSAVAASLQMPEQGRGARQAVAERLSVRQVLARIGLVPAGSNYQTGPSRIKLLRLATSHFTGAAWQREVIESVWPEGCVEENSS